MLSPPDKINRLNTLQSIQNMKVNRGDPEGGKEPFDLITKVLTANSIHHFLSDTDINHLKEVFNMHKLGGQIRKLKARMMADAFHRLMIREPALWKEIERVKISQLKEMLTPEHVKALTKDYREHLQAFPEYFPNITRYNFEASNNTLNKLRESYKQELQMTTIGRERAKNLSHDEYVIITPDDLIKPLKVTKKK